MVVVVVVVAINLLMKNLESKRIEIWGLGMLLSSCLPVLGHTIPAVVKAVRGNNRRMRGGPGLNVSKTIN